MTKPARSTRKARRVSRLTLPRVFVVSVLLVATVVLATPDGPPDRRTGAPGDAGDCTSCHSDYPVNSGPGQVNVSETGGMFDSFYLPGREYTVTVTVRQAGMTRWGFELTALKQSGNTFAGDFKIVDAANTAKTTSAGRQYVKQTAAGTRAGTPNGPVTWSVNWTAPAAGSGTVVFYAAGMGSNNDDLDGGDYVYTTSRAVAEAAPPAVAFTAPGNGDKLSGVVTVRASAADPSGIARVEFRLDSVLQASDLTPPYEWSWDTRTATNDVHVLNATGYSNFGLSSSAGISVAVDNDAPPQVSILSPAEGARLTWTVDVVANASDNSAVARVEFRLDGALKETRTSAPFVGWCNTRTTFNGPHVVRATAVDDRGSAASASVNVTVDNPTSDRQPPSVVLVSPQPGDTLRHSAPVAVDATDDTLVVQVEFRLDGAVAQVNSTGPGARYVWVWDTRGSANGSHRLDISALDPAGNRNASIFEVEVDNDRTPPEVAILSPKDGSRVAGTVPVRAEARDASGVARVEIRHDDEIKANLTSTPYEWTWDTAQDPGDPHSGPHHIAAVAVDTEGNEARTEVRITTVRDEAPPAVEILAPGDGVRLKGTVLVTAAASDDSEVVAVEFFLDASKVQENATAPYVWVYDTTLSPLGKHSITVTARDLAGRTNSSTVGVRVDNRPRPVATIASPSDGALLGGVVEIAGGASAGTLLVQVRVDTGEWVNATGDESWTVAWDTKRAEDRAYTIRARAYNGEDYSREVAVSVTVSNPGPPPAAQEAGKLRIDLPPYAVLGMMSLSLLAGAGLGLRAHVVDRTRRRGEGDAEAEWPRSSGPLTGNGKGLGKRLASLRAEAREARAEMRPSVASGMRRGALAVRLRLGSAAGLDHLDEVRAGMRERRERMRAIATAKGDLAGHRLEEFERLGAEMRELQEARAELDRLRDEFDGMLAALGKKPKEDAAAASPSPSARLEDALRLEDETRALEAEMERARGEGRDLGPLLSRMPVLRARRQMQLDALRGEADRARERVRFLEAEREDGVEWSGDAEELAALRETLLGLERVEARLGPGREEPGGGPPVGGGGGLRA